MAISVSKPAKGLREAIVEIIGRGASVINGMTKGAAQDELEVSRKNWIINGDMQVSQRGDYTSATAATHTNYYIDRWAANSTVANELTHFSTNQPAGASGKSAKYEATATNASAIFGAVQHIEDKNYALLSNRTFTLSAWVKSNSSNARLAIKENASWFTISDSHSGDGTWQKLSFTGTFDTLSSGLLVLIGLHSPTAGSVSITSGDYIEFTQVKLEIGDTATPFESRSYAEELRDCQRYYQRITQDGSANLLPLGACFANSSTNIRTALHLPVEMRAAPTIAVSAAADFTSYIDATAYAATAVGTVASSPTSPVIYMTVTGATDGQTGYGQIEASSSGWIDFLAEL